MRLQPRLLARFILALLLVLPSHTAAMEILELTGGSITFNDAQLPFLGTMAVHGPRVAITARFQAIGGSGEPGFKGCSGVGACQPGDTISVGGEWSGGDFLGHGLLGTVTLDGITHTGEVGACCFDDGLFMTLAGTVLIPDFGNIASVVLTAPFTLDGFLSRTSEPPFPNMFPDMTVYGLHGQGEFLLALHRAPSGSWQWDSMVFELQPIPEPATLLLWGTGAAGLGVARWIRRRRSG